MYNGKHVEWTDMYLNGSIAWINHYSQQMMITSYEDKEASAEHYDDWKTS